MPAENYNLPGYITAVMQRLQANGFEVYVVGGAVRDLLLLKTPLDYDLTTNALPEQMIEIFNDRKLVLTGLKHGTVTVIEQHCPVEITTYRVDGRYTDNRHPDSVQFTPDIKKDLARRDFTVNAMCYQSGTGVLDPFGGRQDLAAGILRTVGEPDCRFKEDALRILRALRFAATLGFGLQQQTETAVFSQAILLRAVSRERILAELKKLLLGKFAAPVLTNYLYVLLCAEPALAAVIGRGSDPVSFLEVDRCPAVLPLRVAAFFACLGRANQELNALPKLETADLGRLCRDPSESDLPLCQNAAAAMQTLRFDRKTTQTVLNLLRLLFLKTPQTESDYYALCGFFGPKLTADACRLKAAFYGNTAEMQAFEDACSRCFAGCCTVAQLNVTGGQLKALGLSGKAVGRALNGLLLAVQRQQCPNEQGALLRFANENFVDRPKG